jgi:hypothetical protein
LLEYSHIEIPAKEAVRIHDEAGEPSLELSLSPEHGRKSRGNRGELSVDLPFIQGDTIRYEWQFMLPAEFTSDAPRNRWWLIAQWHDQPDRVRGESWEGHPERSPSIALSIRKFPVSYRGLSPQNITPVPGVPNAVNGSRR